MTKTTNRLVRTIPQNLVWEGDQIRLLDNICASMGIIPHKGQREFLRRRKKAKFLITGRRWGKSFVLAIEVILHHIEMMGLGIEPRVRIVAPRHDQIREIVNYVAKACKAMNLKFVDRTRDTSDPRFYIDGYRVDTRVSEKQTAHRSAYATLLCIDEARDVNPIIYEEAMKPLLVDYDGRLVVVTSPKGEGWYVQEAKKYGLEPYYGTFPETMTDFYESETDRAYWIQAPSWTNPYIQTEAIWEEQKSMSIDRFLQEFGAAILREHGHPFPKEPTVFMDLPPQVRQYHALAIGVDYGFVDAFCALWVLKDPSDHYWVTNEIYQSGLSPTDQAEAMLRIPIPNGTVISTDPDLWAEKGYPTALMYWKSVFDEHNRSDLVWSRGLGKRKDYIVRLRQMLEEGRVLIHSSCTNLLNEIRGAKRKPNNPEDIAKPDHAIMALSYAIDQLESVELPKRYSKNSHEFWTEVLEYVIRQQIEEREQEAYRRYSVWNYGDDRRYEPRDYYLITDIGEYRDQLNRSSFWSD